VIISLFGNVRVRPGMEEHEAKLTEELEQILRSMPGFISYKYYEAEDGEGIGIVRFETREHLEAWVHEGRHGRMQTAANDYYEAFWVQTAEVYREYTWRDGQRTARDLTWFFRGDVEP
jgi:antibiotic biosynthesis monooxygenase (ABM) superfamily enzyme